MNPSPNAHRFAPERALELGRQTLSIEAAAVEALQERLNGDFARAVELILNSHGRLIVSGMGKSGHIARKIAATMASTGTPAYFVHPAEASHGDLGMITRDDVLLALSNSGESGELLSILPALKRQGAKIIAMTGVPSSTLAREADIHLDAGVEQEACPHNLAPTASTTAALALGDALAVALLDARGFGPEDFARSHPGGSLGRRLLTHVRDVMRGDDRVPAVKPDTAITDAIIAMSRGGLGLVAVTNAANTVLGIFTDGDLRRRIEAGADLRTATAGAVMHAGPRTIAPSALAADAAAMMEEHGITSVLVVEGARLVGLVHVRDLMRAKVI